jgi:hypothetical protein
VQLLNTINTSFSKLIIILFFIGLTVSWFLNTSYFLSWDFRNNLWAPAYLLLTGKDPYSVYQHFPGSNALWLPVTVGLFLPTGLLEAAVASNLWLLANIAMLGMVIWFVAGTNKISPSMFAKLLLVFFLSPLVISHLYFGQVTIFFVLMSLLAVKWRQVGGGFLAGVLVAAALAKPQLAVLVLPGLIVSFWKDNKGQGTLSFLGGIVCGSFILSIPFWISNLQWWLTYLDALKLNPTWAHPNLFTVLQLTLGQFGLVIWILLFIVLSGINVWLWLRFIPEIAVIWSLGLTAVASPYLFSYDFVLLVPLIAWLIIRSRSLAQRLYLITGWLLSSGLMLWIRVSTDNDDRHYWWFPLFIFAWILLVNGFNRLINKIKSGELSFANLVISN